MHIVFYLRDVIGIIGVLLVLIAYYMLNTHRLHASHLSYQILNLIGSMLILFTLFFAWNTSAVIIEVAWIIISLIGAYRIIKYKYLNDDY